MKVCYEHLSISPTSVFSAAFYWHSPGVAFTCFLQSISDFCKLERQRKRWTWLLPAFSDWQRASMFFLSYDKQGSLAVCTLQWVVIWPSYLLLTHSVGETNNGRWCLSSSSSSSVTLPAGRPAAGRVGGRAADTPRRASTVTSVTAAPCFDHFSDPRE